ncbi:hypothetical protein G3N92_33705 [Burkholderia sp. Ac-20379]|nr:hypothetical protein [Burkholderia sp. Ac-20379]
MVRNDLRFQNALASAVIPSTVRLLQPCGAARIMCAHGGRPDVGALTKCFPLLTIRHANGSKIFLHSDGISPHLHALSKEADNADARPLSTHTT